MYENFFGEMEDILVAGHFKGYGDALRTVCRQLPHALAEIVYKAVRYNHKRDPQDLIKIAAWAALEWYDNADDQGSGTGNHAWKTSARAAHPRPQKRRTGAGKRSTGIITRGR